MKNAVAILALLLFGGCGALWQPGVRHEPMKPTAQNSDLVFVRTGDRAYYYVIDKKRHVCFFHSTLYGKQHMTEMDCNKLPEFNELVGNAPRTRTRPSPRAAAKPRPAPVAPARPAPAARPTTLSNEDRNAFRRAYIQHFCARRSGTEEPLAAILPRHGLDARKWNAAKTEFSADKDLWSALTTEAMEACP